MTATEIKKAKDWDEFEIFYKINRVGTPKVHTLKLRQDPWTIYGQHRLWVHCSRMGQWASATDMVGTVAVDDRGLLWM